MFGANIKSLREQRGWSREKLGEAAGVDQSTIWRLEAEAYDPKLSTLKAVASGLGVAVAALLEERQREDEQR